MSRIRSTAMALAALAGAACISSFARAADDPSAFEARVAPFLQKPSFAAPDCMKGKSILSIPVSSANPFTRDPKIA